MPSQKLILDYIYEHETARADQVFLTQPVGGGKVVDYTWRQMMDQARRMATHLKGRGFEPGVQRRRLVTLRAAAGGFGAGVAGFRRLHRRRLAPAQPDPERGVAGPRLEVELAAVAAHDRAHERQAEAEDRKSVV